MISRRICGNKLANERQRKQKPAAFDCRRELVEEQSPDLRVLIHPSVAAKHSIQRFPRPARG